MARPKIYQERRITTAVRLPESLHQRLQEAAQSRDVSVNYLLIKAADHYLRSELVPLEAAASSE